MQRRCISPVLQRALDCSFFVTRASLHIGHNDLASTSDGCRHEVTGRGWQEYGSRSNLQHFSTVGRATDTVFSYKGPLSQPIRNLKRLSLAGCLVSVIGGPILVFGSAGQMPLAAQLSVCLAVSGFGIFTTGLLHWFTSPYVHGLQYDRSSGSAEALTLSPLARMQKTAFHESEVEYPETLRPQVTFQVKNKFFYLDAAHFEDKKLLARLSPSGSEMESGKQEESKQALHR